MRAPLTTLLFAAWVASLATSCGLGRRQPIVDVTVRNSTTNKLGWAELVWGEGSLSIGVFLPGKGITYGDTGLPNSVKTNTATIEFVNEDDPRVRVGSEDERVAMRRQLIQKVPVDVSPLRQLAPGHYQATFNLLSLTNAVLAIRLREKRP